MSFAKETNGVGHLVITICLMAFLGVLLFFGKIDTATAMTALGFALGYWYRTTSGSNTTPPATVAQVQQAPAAAAQPIPLDPEATAKMPVPQQSRVSAAIQP